MQRGPRGFGAGAGQYFRNPAPGFAQYLPCGAPGFVPTPDLQTRRFDVVPERLLAAMQDVMLAQPRVTALAHDPKRMRADYVVRSRVFGFPDIVLVQALAAGDGQSELVVYSRSLKGHYDFGVNRSRVKALLSALDGALAQ